MWDTTTEFGQRVERRLADETVLWLVTTDSDGRPQPNPIWFIREGATLLIYSQPNAAKVRHIAARPQVALNFNTDAGGEDVVVLLGSAAIDPQAPPANQVPAYVAKYGPHIPGIGMTAEEMAASYSTAIRVTIERVRGF